MFRLLVSPAVLQCIITFQTFLIHYVYICPCTVKYNNNNNNNILAWVLSMREKHLAISTQMLRDKALLLVRSHNPSFTASEGWIRRFMRRHNLTLRARTSVSQKLPSNLETKINEFHVDVKELRSQHNVGRPQNRVEVWKFPANLLSSIEEGASF